MLSHQGMMKIITKIKNYRYNLNIIKKRFRNASAGRMKDDAA